MKKGLLSLLMLLIVPGPVLAGECRSADLSGQFADPPQRNQCDVGSCHAFGSIGVLEAAIFRQHGRKLRLSEADLFVSKIVTDDAYYARWRKKIAAIKANENLGPGDIAEVSEGGYTTDDLNFALGRGVATEQTVSYPAMLERYRSFRKAERAVLLDQAEQEFKFRQRENPVAVFLSDLLSPDFASLRLEPSSKALTERYLLGEKDYQKAVQEREQNKKLTEGFLLVEEDYKYAPPSSGTAQDPAKCRAAGKRQAEWLKMQLCAHKPRPVVVSMALGGLAAWGQTDTSQHANHAFIIQGFETRPDGKVVYKTRNSWGGMNPDVPDDQMCRIYRTAIVAAPTDRTR